MSKKLKIKKLLNLVVSKPENHNMRRKTSIKNEFEFSRKNKHSFIADTKLKVDKVTKKGGKFQNDIFYFKLKYF